MSAFAVMSLAVGSAQAQSVQTNEELVNELLTYGDANDDEIGNFDFLYRNNGKSLEYDELMVENIIDEAISHLGTRYVYGSKGPNSFDCSGFTSYVYKHQNNVYI